MVKSGKITNLKVVKNKSKIFFDGGVCRGTDVVKAISLGADCIGIGRLQCYAAATNGRKGLNKMIDILTHEILFTPGCSPGLHDLQTVLPSTDATFPKGHTTQLPFLPTFPFGQLEHCTLPLTNVVIPDLQVLQSILPGLVAN